jgi:hypothetical protein
MHFLGPPRPLRSTIALNVRLFGPDSGRAETRAWRRPSAVIIAHYRGAMVNGGGGLSQGGRACRAPP